MSRCLTSWQSIRLRPELVQLWFQAVQDHAGCAQDPAELLPMVTVRLPVIVSSATHFQTFPTFNLMPVWLKVNLRFNFHKLIVSLHTKRVKSDYHNIGNHKHGKQAGAFRVNQTEVPPAAPGARTPAAARGRRKDASQPASRWTGRVGY